MEKITVLLADDHDLFRDGTRRILENEPDIEVVGEASDGDQAIALTTRLRPDVVLMDISMPRVSGIEATRQIKARNSNTAVLILTAYDDDQYVFAILEVGGAGYLLKHVRADDLVNAIRAVHAGESVLHPAIAAKVFARFAPRNHGRDDGAPSGSLTEREMEVLRLAAHGKTNQEIANELFLSRRTVQSHLASVFQKLDVGSRTEAILQALKRGWIVLAEVA